MPVENEDRGSDFGSEYGEEYYPPGFRLPGEKVYEAVWRWWETCNEDDYDAYNARREIRTVRESVLEPSDVAYQDGEGVHPCT
jgi:hypothetical protein